MKTKVQTSQRLAVLDIAHEMHVFAGDMQKDAREGRDPALEGYARAYMDFAVQLQSAVNS